MRTSERDPEKTNPHDLANLRKRLWRPSSILACSVLMVANSAETVASQERWTDNMREDIDELANRTCKLLDLVADLEHGDSKA